MAVKEKIKGEQQMEKISVEELKQNPDIIVHLLLKKGDTKITIIKHNDEITVEEEMPPEERISKKLIEAVEKSEKSIKEGRFTEWESLEEYFKHIDKD